MEMTVKHLRNLQRVQMTGEYSPPPFFFFLPFLADLFQTSFEWHSDTFYWAGSPVFPTVYVELMLLLGRGRRGISSRIYRMVISDLSTYSLYINEPELSIY